MLFAHAHHNSLYPSTLLLSKLHLSYLFLFQTAQTCYCSKLGLLIFKFECSRGENNELRVGVRRAMRQQGVVPSSVISSHSMHLGVLATAWHAYNSGTMFTVYYKPRCVHLSSTHVNATALLINFIYLHPLEMLSEFCTCYYIPSETCISCRTSPAQFIVPYNQYMESVKNQYSIGMRFKMRFEGEEAPEQRYFSRSYRYLVINVMYVTLLPLYSRHGRS